jgi:hypothetical protein
MDSDRHHGRIELSVPARADVVQLARMTATFVASQADLAFEDVADLRLAVDELCAAVLTREGAAGLDRAPGSALRISFGWDRESVEVSCDLSAGRFASASAAIPVPRFHGLNGSSPNGGSARSGDASSNGSSATNGGSELNGSSTVNGASGSDSGGLGRDGDVWFAMSRQILSTLVDDYHIAPRRGWLRMRRIGTLC